MSSATSLSVVANEMVNFWSVSGSGLSLANHASNVAGSNPLYTGVQLAADVAGTLDSLLTPIIKLANLETATITSGAVLKTSSALTKVAPPLAVVSYVTEIFQFNKLLSETDSNGVRIHSDQEIETKFQSLVVGGLATVALGAGLLVTSPVWGATLGATALVLGIASIAIEGSGGFSNIQSFAVARQAMYDAIDGASNAASTIKQEAIELSNAISVGFSETYHGVSNFVERRYSDYKEAFKVVSNNAISFIKTPWGKPMRSLIARCRAD